MSEHAEHSEHEHVGSLTTYALIFFSLLVFTGVTVFAAFQDLGKFNAPVALIIATIKAVLVILFFMHVKDSSRLTKITLTAAIFWLGLLLGLTMTDYLTRPWY